jgi:uncharacterized phage-associated protein
MVVIFHQNKLCRREKNKVVSCFEVANYFIWWARETGSFVSNLKLQKLVYYSQAWHLAIHDTPLFEEDFQAWVHGPVIPELYQKYKSFRWQPITVDVIPQLPPTTIEFLEGVRDEYFSCDGYELEQMTHAEDPWHLARGSIAADVVSTAQIDKTWMKEYYGARVEEN